MVAMGSLFSRNTSCWGCKSGDQGQEIEIACFRVGIGSPCVPDMYIRLPREWDFHHGVVVGYSGFTWANPWPHATAHGSNAWLGELAEQ